MVPPNILLVRFSSIGDLILTTPLLRAIRTRHPAARMTFVVREDLADTLRFNPRIDRLVTWRHGTPLGPLVAELRGEAWTHRLDLHGSLRSRQLALRIGGHWDGYPKHRLRRAVLIATRRRMGGAIGPVAERYFAAARDLDVRPDGGPAEFFTSSDAEREVAVRLEEHGIGRTRRLVALVPGAAHFTKRWPDEHWCELVARIAPTNDVMILGGWAERAIARRMVAAGGAAAISLAGELSLVGSGAALRRADVAVAGDTGLMHMAGAVGTPVVALYGPGVEEFGFFPYNTPSRVLQQPLRCRPCSAHGSARCPLGHHRCLVDTTPEAVAAALARPMR